MLTTRFSASRWTIVKNITGYIGKLCFILDIDISIDNSFKELLFRRVEHVWNLMEIFVSVQLVIFLP